MLRLVLLAVSLTAAAPAPPRAVALDLTRLGDETFQRLDALALERAAMVRLVQEGFAVVPLRSRPELVLKLLDLPGGGVALVGTSGETRLTREVQLAALPVQELQLELVQKLVELARALPRPPEPAPQSPPSPPAPVESAAPTAAAPEPFAVSVSLGAEALWRSPAADFQMRASARLGLRRAFGLHLTGAYSPSGAHGLQIHEWLVAAGAGYRFALGPLDLEASLLAGAAVHTFRLDDPIFQQPEGTRVSPLVSLPVTLTWHPVPALGLTLRVAGRYSQPREHMQEGVSLWRRDDLGLEAGLGVCWEIQ